MRAESQVRAAARPARSRGSPTPPWYTQTPEAAPVRSAHPAGRFPRSRPVLNGAAYRPGNCLSTFSLHIYTCICHLHISHVCMNMYVSIGVYIYVMHLYTYTRSGHTYKMYIGSLSFYETSIYLRPMPTKHLPLSYLVGFETFWENLKYTVTR